MTRSLAPWLALALLLGCNEGDETLRTTIGAAGGFVGDDEVGLDVPPGALDTNVEIAVERIPVPPGYRAVGRAAYRFRPEGIRFSAPVTVRFGVAPGEEDATVFWSSGVASAELEPLPTRLEGNHIEAPIEHFSIGLAGWELSSDAGPGRDGGHVADAAHIGDASTSADAGHVDAGSLPGITCVVTQRTPDCISGTTNTYLNVPFSFLGASDIYGPVSALTSPLAAFNRLSNIPEGFRAEFLADDPAGSLYRVGDSIVPNLALDGLVLTADIDTARYGLACTDVPGALPIVGIRCTGSTLLAAPPCSFVDTSGAEGMPLTCTVSRRDAACNPLGSSTEVPRFWLAEGAHGAESELHGDSPALSELFGAGGVRLYREGPCDVYVFDVRGHFGSVARSGGRLIVPLLTAAGSTPCVDGLGRSMPTLSVDCRGEAMLVSAP